MVLMGKSSTNDGFSWIFQLVMFDDQRVTCPSQLFLKDRCAKVDTQPDAWIREGSCIRNVMRC